MRLMLRAACLLHIIHCIPLCSGSINLWNLDVQDKYKSKLESWLSTPKHAKHHVLQHIAVSLEDPESIFVLVSVVWVWSNVLLEGSQAWAINQILVVLEHHNYACTQMYQHGSAIATSFCTELIYVDTQWSNLHVPIVPDVMSVNEWLVNVCHAPHHDSGDISWRGLSTNPWPHNSTCISGQPTFVRDLTEFIEIFL